jgi:hypothetical protein
MIFEAQEWRMKAWTFVGVVPYLAMAVFASQPGCESTGLTCAELMGKECSPPAVPDGWTGHDWIRLSSGQDLAPACPAGAQQRTYYEGPLNDYNANPWCSACACANLAGAKCELRFECFVGSKCEGAPTGYIAPAACVANIFAEPHACRLKEKRATGSCTVTAAKKSTALPFQARVDSCTGAEGLPGEGVKQCVHRDGVQAACPSDWPEMHVVFAAFADNRDCSCACETSCTEGGLQQFPGAACNGTPLQAAPQACLGIQPGPGLFQIDPGTATCTTKVTPSGQVDPKDPVTFCCR